MKGIAFIFVLAGVICALGGMAWGLHMSISHDHLMAPAHAHLNLVGWVSLTLFGLYYHTVPQAAVGILPKAHAVVAILGVAAMAPGIALAISEKGEALAAIGSLLTLLSMLIFAAVVLTSRRTD